MNRTIEAQINPSSVGFSLSLITLNYSVSSNQYEYFFKELPSDEEVCGNILVSENVAHILRNIESVNV